MKEAAASLAQSTDPDVVPRLCEELRLFGPSSEQHDLIIAALEKIHDRRAIPALIDALKGWSSPAAARALGNFQDPQAFEPLVSKLDHRSAEVRTAVVEALGKMRDHRAMKDLERLALTDSDLQVRKIAANVLSSWGVSWGPPAEKIREAMRERLGLIARLNGSTGRSSMSQMHGIWSQSSSDEDTSIRQALEDLHFYLRHFLNKVESDDLKKIVALTHLFIVREKYGCMNESIGSETIEIDSQLTRQLARQELSRRGIAA